ncbi:unnamed protein product [Ilex paraguariensis]|uniref:GDSL esterase/lipase n=1 Tax=Ilex paraguariensis TaxID=185542 RepID=A0ABC8RCX5_9AQUA
MASRWVLLLSLAIVSVNLAEADLEAIFVFGDSIVDVGTNNDLNSSAKANYPYYGIDYPYSQSTGRFSNGYNTADMIVKQLGDYQKSPPPFLSLTKRMSTFNTTVLRGVNFASAGSGIFHETGQKFGEVIPLGLQIQQFTTVQANITAVLSPDKAQRLISNSLYIISVGSNDLFDYQEKPTVPPETLLINLTEAYCNHLKDLYNLGARKFAVIGVPPIGCVPAVRAHNTSGGGCQEEMNELARAFYNATENLLLEFSIAFNGVKYSLGNSYAITMNIIHNPRANRRHPFF